MHSGTAKSALPSLSAARARYMPIAREPASPMSTVDGSVLRSRYALITAAISPRLTVSPPKPKNATLSTP